MKTNVRDSSISAYYDVIYGDVDKKQRILSFVRMKKNGTTRREISVELQIDTATVSGLVTPAVKQLDLMESELKSSCPITKRQVHWLHHPDNQAGQLPLI